MTRIIGCGNSDRGDDAAGILVARRLRERGVDAVEHCGDGLALMELWERDDEVILVDAVVSGSNPGSISKWDAITQRRCAPNYRCSTHAFGPLEAIELARALDRLPRAIQIYGIEAVNFKPGSKPSREVLDALDRVVGDLAWIAR